MISRVCPTRIHLFLQLCLTRHTSNIPAQKKELNGWQMMKYGHLDSDWRDTLRRGFGECFRVLKPNGLLVFKWNETDIPLSEILKLTEQKPVLGHRSGKRSNTHWVLFIKT